MSEDLDTVKDCVATIEDRLQVMKIMIARLDEVSDAQSLASDRDAWQTSVGALLSLIETHTEACNEPDDDRCVTLLQNAIRIVNTNRYTGKIDEPRADVARMNFKATIDHAIAAGLVVRRPLIDDLGDLGGAIKTLEADVMLDPDTSEAEADAMRVLINYARLAEKMLRFEDG